MKERKTKIPLPCEKLTDRILECYYQTLRSLGTVRGTPVHIFRGLLTRRLKRAGLHVSQGKLIELLEQGQPVGNVKIEMVVEHLVIVCVRNVLKVTDKHKCEGTYQMECGGYPAGLLLNYGSLDRKPVRLAVPRRYRQGPWPCNS